jgi:hypothetical protein
MIQKFDLQYLKDTKRALERLRSKRLAFYASDGEYCCATFCVAAHRAIKDEIPQAMLVTVARGNRVKGGVYDDTAAHIALEVNDKFRPGDNSAGAQKLRYKHVYKWVCKTIKEIEHA